MIEEYPECKSREELLKYERQYLEMLGATLNKQVPGRTLEEYRENNRGKINTRQRDYNKRKKEEISVKKREKVICEFCGSQSDRGHIRRHQKTQKCLSHQK